MCGKLRIGFRSPEIAGIMPRKYDMRLLLSFLCQPQRKKKTQPENVIVIEALCIGNRGNLSLGMESFEVHANSKMSVGFCFLGGGFGFVFLMNAYVLVIMPLCNGTQQTQDLRGKQNKNEICYSKYCTKFGMLHPSINVTFCKIKILLGLSSAFIKV